MSIIREVEEVREEKDKFPFVCPICRHVDLEADYLRFFLEGEVNPSCVHSHCAIIKIFGKSSFKPSGKHC